MERDGTNFINDLVSYGLTPMQAQTYVTLLILGNATAKSISLSSGVNRVDVYRALRNLKKHGIVEERLANPTKFVAADPDQALDVLISSKLRVIDRLRQSKDELKRKLYDLKRESAPVETKSEEDGSEMFLRVILGQQMFRRVQSVVLESKREIVTVFVPSVMLIYDEMGIPELEAEKRRSQVGIRAITNINPQNLDQCAKYANAVELRHNDVPTSQLRYTIVDEEKLILVVGQPPTNITEGTALWTNSKILIAALKTEFESLWAQSIPAKERIKVLRSAGSGKTDTSIRYNTRI